MDRRVLQIYEKAIREYLDNDNKTPEVVDRFWTWLFSGNDCQEKEIAMRRLFFEALDKYPLDNVTSHDKCFRAGNKPDNNHH